MTSAKQRSAKQRLEAFVLAQMNEEHASLCARDQQALKAFLEMNARFLRSIAEDAPPLRLVQ